MLKSGTRLQQPLIFPRDSKLSKNQLIHTQVVYTSLHETLFAKNNISDLDI
jgi:hypothetical protein